ncbi:vesicle-associated membrane protein 8-like [Ostrea edulis]|uniref:vesicle-associated membrane protein 8-like n=1 Tax=Ostrea edulis TaxID=37623 RepID=UPI002095DC0C|nr:vesicle-associated membrane protein 8-like [Ostrea edulis]
MSRSGESRDRLDELTGEVSEVTSLLKDNVDKVLRRGDKLDDIQQKADDLESSSIQFQRSSRSLRRKMCCSNIKMTLILILVVIIVIAVIVVIILMTVKPWEHSNSGNSNHRNGSLAIR